MDLTYLRNNKTAVEALQKDYAGFLDSTRTATARGTFYNSRNEIEENVAGLHTAVIGADRGVYAATLLMGGVTEFTQQVGIYSLLANQRDGAISFMDSPLENMVVNQLLAAMRPPKVFDLFLTLRKQRLTGQRSKHFILKYILNSNKLPFWSVKYRRKLQLILTHAWGQHLTAILTKLLSKRLLMEREKKILADNILAYTKDTNKEAVYDCVAFILRSSRTPRLTVLKAYEESKTNLDAGSILPYETLEGLRSTFHKSVEKGKVLEITKGTLTTKQKQTFQRKGTKENVKVEWDPRTANLVDLVRYCYEQGVTDELWTTIDFKAKAIARNLPDLGNIQIILDTSLSMRGSGTQLMRPISIGYAVAQVLTQAATACNAVGDFPQPTGETALAGKLVEALAKGDIDGVFIISDGYENAPAGRIAEVMGQVRKMGITIPVYHINPTMASEASGVRKLSNDIRVMPISNPSSLSSAFMDNLLHTDVVAALEMLIPRVLPQLEG